MKFVGEEKLYSLYEVSTASSFSRKYILELEKLGLIIPTYKDEDTNYRYYDPLIILKLKEIKLFLDAKMSLEEIRLHYLNQLNKEEEYFDLEKRIDAINTCKLLFKENQKRIYKSRIKETIYYYEERNITSIDMLPNLLKNVYIHALSKDYIFADTNPFILFNKKVLDNPNSPFRIKICLPLLKAYKEENIEILKENNVLCFDSSNITFEESLSSFSNLINDNNYKIKDIVLRYFYYSDPKINRIITFINN